ncbi:MAG: hypothetical protein ACKOGH_18365 [Alphaproteobacteria bacterium]
MANAICSPLEQLALHAGAPTPMLQAAGSAGGGVVKPEERRALERQILERLATIRGRVAPESVEALRRAVTPAGEEKPPAPAAEAPPQPSARALAAMKAYRAGRGR